MSRRRFDLGQRHEIDKRRRTVRCIVIALAARVTLGYSSLQHNRRWFEAYPGISRDPSHFCNADLHLRDALQRERWFEPLFSNRYFTFPAYRSCGHSAYSWKAKEPASTGTETPGPEKRFTTTLRCWTGRRGKTLSRSERREAMTMRFLNERVGDEKTQSRGNRCKAETC